MGWNAFLDDELISELERRGYIVRHKREAGRTLSWHRTEPVPEGISFEDEALEKLREQLAPEHIRFYRREGRGGPDPAIRSAVLLLL